MTAAEMALAADRWIFAAAAMLVFGIAVFTGLLAPARLGDHLARRLRGLTIGSGLLAAAAALVWLSLDAATLGEGVTAMSLLTTTSFGRMWAGRSAVAVSLAIIACGRSPRLTAAAAGLTLASLAFSGHARLDDGWLGVVHQANDAMHVITAGGWFGALVPLLPCLRALSAAEWRSDAVLALRHFSRAGHGAVAVALLTGIGNTALVLGRWPTDWLRPYQALLAAKIAAVAGMVALALLNRYRFVPRMRQDASTAIRAIALGTLAEIILGGAVLALVAVFGLLDPG